MKLLYSKYDTDGYTYGCTKSIPFECESKMKFVEIVLQRIDEAKEKEERNEYPWVRLFGDENVTIEELEGFEDNIYTLEEWFEKEKTEL